MADKWRLSRWILGQNYTENQIKQYNPFSLIKFDVDAWLYWIDPVTGYEEKDSLYDDPIYVNESIIGISKIGTAVL